MSMPSIVELQYYCGLALAFCGMIFVLLKCWNELRYRSKGMPPGTMGWPIFGETAVFLKKGPDFMKGQKARYLPFSRCPFYFFLFFLFFFFGCTHLIISLETKQIFLFNFYKIFPQTLLNQIVGCGLTFSIQ